jgi:hypothetical protein
MHEYSLSSVVDTGSKSILAILYLNFLSVCAFTISCSSYIPTLSYLATFRTHDLVVLMALSFFSFLLLLIFIAWHIKVSGDIDTCDSLIMVILETAICVLGITVGIIDESNGIDFNPVDNLHHFLSFSLCILGVVWVYYALSFLEKVNLTLDEKIALKRVWNIYILGLVFVFLTLYEWHFAYTIYNNFFTNTIVESIFEWTLITLTIRFPYNLSKVLNFSVKVSVKDETKN